MQPNLLLKVSVWRSEKNHALFIFNIPALHANQKRSLIMIMITTHNTRDCFLWKRRRAIVISWKADCHDFSKSCYDFLKNCRNFLKSCRVPEKLSQFLEKLTLSWKTVAFSKDCHGLGKLPRPGTVFSETTCFDSFPNVHKKNYQL